MTSKQKEVVITTNAYNKVISMLQMREMQYQTKDHMSARDYHAIDEIKSIRQEIEKLNNSLLVKDHK
jgi:hypothetical protein